MRSSRTNYCGNKKQRAKVNWNRKRMPGFSMNRVNRAEIRIDGKHSNRTVHMLKPHASPTQLQNSAFRENADREEFLDVVLPRSRSSMVTTSRMQADSVGSIAFDPKKGTVRVHNIWQPHPNLQTETSSRHHLTPNGRKAQVSHSSRRINTTFERSEPANSTRTRAVYQRQGAQIAGSQRTTSVDSSPQRATTYTPSAMAKIFCDGIKYTAMSIHRACMGRETPDRNLVATRSVSCIRNSDTTATGYNTQLSPGSALSHSVHSRQPRSVQEAYGRGLVPQNLMTQTPVQPFGSARRSTRANTHVPQKTLSEFVFKHTKTDNALLQRSSIADVTLSPVAPTPSTHGKLDNAFLQHSAIADRKLSTVSPTPPTGRKLDDGFVQHSTIADRKLSTVSPTPPTDRKLDNAFMQHSTIAHMKLSTVSPTPPTDGKLHKVSRESGCPVETHTGHQTPAVFSVKKHPVTAKTSTAGTNNTLVGCEQNQGPAASIIMPVYQSATEGLKINLTAPTHTAYTQSTHARTGAVSDSNTGGYYAAPATIMQKYGNENEHTSIVPVVRLETPAAGVQSCNPVVTVVNNTDVSGFAHGVSPIAMNGSSHDWHSTNIDPHTISMQTMTTAATHNNNTNSNANSTPIEKNHTSMQSSTVAVGSVAVASKEPTTKQPDLERQSVQPVDLHAEVVQQVVHQSTVKDLHQNLSATINQPRNNTTTTRAVTPRKRNQPAAQASVQADTTVLGRERRSPRTGRRQRTNSTVSGISTPDHFTKPRPLQAPKIHASPRAKPEEWNRSDSLQKRRRLLAPTSQYIKG